MEVDVPTVVAAEIGVDADVPKGVSLVTNISAAWICAGGKKTGYCCTNTVIRIKIRSPKAR